MESHAAAASLLVRAPVSGISENSKTETSQNTNNHKNQNKNKNQQTSENTTNLTHDDALPAEFDAERSRMDDDRRLSQLATPTATAPTLLGEGRASKEGQAPLWAPPRRRLVLPQASSAPRGPAVQGGELPSFSQSQPRPSLSQFSSAGARPGSNLADETVLAVGGDGGKSKGWSLLFGFADLDSGALRYELSLLSFVEQPPSLVLAVGVSIRDNALFAIARHSDGAVPCALIAAGHRSSAVEAAVRAMQAAGGTAAIPSAFLVCDLPAGELCALETRVVAIPSAEVTTAALDGAVSSPLRSSDAPLSSEPSGDVRALLALIDADSGCLTWFHHTALPSETTARLASIVGAHVASFTAPLTPQDGLSFEDIFRGAGASQLGAIAQPLALPKQDHAAFAARRAYADQATRSLAAALRAFPGNSTLASYVRSWADQVAFTQWAEVPQLLQGAAIPLDAGPILHQPFFVRFKALVTAPIPRPPPQLPVDACFKPQSISDILKPWALEKMEGWFRQALADLQRMLKDLEAGLETRRHFNKTCVIGQSGFHEKARGIVWDMRGAEIVPLDFDAPICSHLDTERLGSLLCCFPDQALISHLTQGVTYGADLALQIVLSPHLISLPQGALSVESNLRRFQQLGWYGFYSQLPFLPIRLLSQGTAPQKGKHRRTTEGGGPRQLTTDEEGRIVQSINDAVALRSDELDLATQLRETPWKYFAVVGEGSEADTTATADTDHDSEPDDADQIESDSLLAHSLGAIDPSADTPSSTTLSEAEVQAQILFDADVARTLHAGGLLSRDEPSLSAPNGTSPLDCHGGVPAAIPELGSALEDCAGVASLTAALLLEGFGSLRLNDIDPAARFACRCRLGSDAVVDDCMQQPPWTALTAAQRRGVTTLVGGYPCQGISTANPARRGADDPRSLLCLQGLDILADSDFNANQLGNLSLILTEAPTNKDTQYPALGDDERARASTYGYSRNTMYFLSSDFGDPQCRLRAISATEPTDFVTHSGPPSAPAALGICRSLADLTEDHATRPAHLLINAKSFEEDRASPLRRGAPWRCGWVHFEDEKFPVWDDSANAFTVKASGAPPKYSGGAIYRCHRTGTLYALTARECWLLQGLAYELYESLHGWLEQRGVPADQVLRRLAGNAISKGVASAMARFAKSRRLEYLAWRAARSPHKPMQLGEEEFFDVETAEVPSGKLAWALSHTEDATVDLCACRRSPPEDKPHACDLVHDWTILCCAAAIWKEPVFGVSDDVKDFFCQLRTNPTEYWKTCLYWVDLTDTGADSTVVAEYCVGFGISSSSNIAQRFAWSLIWILEQRFDAEEDLLFAAERDPARLDYISARRTLSLKTGRNECRLYAARMYTDDIHLTIVGIDRTVRLLRCWGDLTQEIHLIMAGPEKRQIGASQTWVGIQWNTTLGFAHVPPAKLLRATERLSALADGSRSFMLDEYRSLMGLLEHLLIFTGLRRDAMAGLYEALSGEARDNANVPLALSDFARRQLRRWCTRLATCPGVNFSDLVGPHHAKAYTEALLAKQPLCVVAYVDAAKEGAAIPGIGGYMLGAWWTMPLGPLLLQLPIPVLEFLGIIVNIIVFGDRVVAPICLLTASDSVTSVLAALNMSSHAPLMQFLHMELLETPQLQRLGPRALIVHRYGEGNHIADASSRGNFDELHQALRALGVDGVQVALPDSALRLASRLCDEARSRGCFEEPAATVDSSGERHGSRHSESLENGESSMVGRTCDNDATTESSDAHAWHADSNSSPISDDEVYEDEADVSSSASETNSDESDGGGESDFFSAAQSGDADPLTAPGLAATPQATQPVSSDGGVYEDEDGLSDENAFEAESVLAPPMPAFEPVAAASEDGSFVDPLRWCESCLQDDPHDSSSESANSDGYHPCSHCLTCELLLCSPCALRHVCGIFETDTGSGNGESSCESPADPMPVSSTSALTHVIAPPSTRKRKRLPTRFIVCPPCSTPFVSSDAQSLKACKYCAIGNTCDKHAALEAQARERYLLALGQDLGHEFHLAPGAEGWFISELDGLRVCPWCFDIEGAPERCALCDQTFCEDCLITGVCFACGTGPDENNPTLLRLDNRFSQRQLHSLLRCEARDHGSRSPRLWRGEHLDATARLSIAAHDRVNEALWRSFALQANEQHFCELAERDLSSLRVAIGSVRADPTSSDAETLTVALAMRGLAEREAERQRIAVQIEDDYRFALLVADLHGSRHSTSLEIGLASIGNRLCDNNAMLFRSGVVRFCDYCGECECCGDDQTPLRGCCGDDQKPLRGCSGGHYLCWSCLIIHDYEVQASRGTKRERSGREAQQFPRRPLLNLTYEESRRVRRGLPPISANEHEYAERARTRPAGAVPPQLPLREVHPRLRASQPSVEPASLWPRNAETAEATAHISRDSESIELGLKSMLGRTCDNDAQDETFRRTPNDAEVLAGIRWAFESLDLESGITKRSLRRAVERKLHCPRGSLDSRRHLFSTELDSLIRRQRPVRDSEPAISDRGPVTRAALRRRSPVVLRAAVQTSRNDAPGQASKPSSRVGMLLRAASALDSPAHSASPPTAQDVAAFAAVVDFNSRAAALSQRLRLNKPPSAHVSRDAASLANGLATMISRTGDEDAAMQPSEVSLRGLILGLCARGEPYSYLDESSAHFNCKLLRTTAETLLHLEPQSLSHRRDEIEDAARLFLAQSPTPTQLQWQRQRHQEARAETKLIRQQQRLQASQQSQLQLPEHVLHGLILGLCKRLPTHTPDSLRAAAEKQLGLEPQSLTHRRDEIEAIHKLCLVSEQQQQREQQRLQVQRMKQRHARELQQLEHPTRKKGKLLAQHVSPKRAGKNRRTPRKTAVGETEPERGAPEVGALNIDSLVDLAKELEDINWDDGPVEGIFHAKCVADATAAAAAAAVAADALALAAAAAQADSLKADLDLYDTDHRAVNLDLYDIELGIELETIDWGELLPEEGSDVKHEANPPDPSDATELPSSWPVLQLDTAGEAHRSKDSESLELRETTMLGRTGDAAAAARKADFAPRLSDGVQNWQRQPRQPALSTGEPARGADNADRGSGSPDGGGARSGDNGGNSTREPTLHPTPKTPPRPLGPSPDSRGGDRARRFDSSPTKSNRRSSVHSPTRLLPGSARLADESALDSPARAARPKNAHGSPSVSQPPREDDYVASGRAASLQLTNMVIGGDSATSLRPADVDATLRLAAQVDSFCEMAASAGTQLRDSTAWRKYWVPFCEMLGTSTWRCTFGRGEALDEHRETWLQTAFFIYVFNNMKPRSASDVVPKPTSCLNMLFGVRAIHRRAGIPMTPAIRIQAALKGLHRHFIATHPRGVAGLTPHRREPFSLEQSAKLQSVPDGFRHGQIRVDYSKRSWNSMRLACKINRPLGMRNRDMFQQLLSLASVKFSLGGTVFAAPSRDKLMAASRGDAAILVFPPLKNDPLGQHFAPHPAWLALDTRDPHCAARALIDNELDFPVSPNDRENHALLPGDDGKTALSPEHARMFFQVFLVYAVGTQNLQWFSFHSWRVTLASALLAIGASTDQICRLVRWVGTSSLAIYARLEPERQMSLRRRALAQDPTAIAAERLPDLRGNNLAIAANEAADALAQRTLALGDAEQPGTNADL